MFWNANKFVVRSQKRISCVYFVLQQWNTNHPTTNKTKDLYYLTIDARVNRAKFEKYCENDIDFIITMDKIIIILNKRSRFPLSESCNRQYFERGTNNNHSGRNNNNTIMIIILIIYITDDKIFPKISVCSKLFLLSKHYKNGKYLSCTLYLFSIYSYMQRLVLIHVICCEQSTLRIDTEKI